MVAVPACLLAVPLFLACACQADAQTSTRPAQNRTQAQANQTPISSGNFGRGSRQTPLEVLHGAATFTNHYDPEKMLRLAVVLAVPHPGEEKQFLEDVQDKQSPRFHQFLSSEEWTARFGPSVENEQAVVDWARNQDLTVTHRYGSRLVVDLEGKAGTIEKALNLTINNYLLPPEHGLGERTVYSNDRDPILPSNLDGVVDAVLGLNSIEVARPRGGSGPLVPRPDYVAGPVAEELGEGHGRIVAGEATAAVEKLSPTRSGATPNGNPPSYYWSSAAYDYQALMNQGHCCNPLNNASGHSPRESSIAIASFGDVSFSDMSGFTNEFGLNWNVLKIGIDGGYTCDNSKGADGNCTEVTMDTEWSTAMANYPDDPSKTARVIVYEGSVYSNATIMDVYTNMEADAHARTMSTSWGWAENTQFSSNPEMDTYNTTMQSVDKVFSSMVGEGWTLLAASGDNGATDGCGDADRVDFPSSDPNVIAVGGTTLNEGSGSNYEVAWTGGQFAGNATQQDSCGSNHGGSTGGFSEYWGPPSYQGWLGFSKRAVPDIALDATYAHDVLYDGSWANLAGTSVSTPMMAGFFAQENAYLLSIGDKCGSDGTSVCSPLGNANYPIYATAHGITASASPFYDIVSGCNSNDITTKYTLPYFCATPGFDEVTGWGSANMLRLAWAINWQVTAANGIPSINFSGPNTNAWYNSNQTVNWTVVDYSGGGGLPGTGIAGENQSWDATIGDVRREAHGGSGNPFYSGPQFPNGASGCLAFSDNGCSGGASAQGCHTAHVLAWNNQGVSTGEQTYGPLCYDTVNPTIALSASPAKPANLWYNTPVSITLSASDPGGSGASGVAKVYYGLSTSSCSTADTGACSVYGGAFTVSAQGAYFYQAFSEDRAGNFSNSVGDIFGIDTAPPVTTAGFSGTLNGNEWQSAVTIVLKATDNLSGVAATYYSLDGGANVKYAASIQVSAPGNHTFSYWSVDAAGNTEKTNSLSFVVESLTTVALAVSPNPSVEGQAVKLTATVAASLGGTIPGSVTFWDGSKSLGTGTMTGGVATLSVATLPVGSDALHAVYGGGVYYQPSTSVAVNEAVMETTQTTVISSVNPSDYGQSVTFTASVKPSISGTPTGTVRFYNSGTLLGTLSVTAGVATLTTKALPPGANPIRAFYSGDNTYEKSSTATLTQTVNKRATATALIANANPSAFDEPVTFTATVASNAGTPAGTVTFLAGTATLGSEVLSGGVARLTTSALALGTNSITAVYAGTADYSESTSKVISEVTEAARTTTKVVSSLDPANLNAELTFTATVSPVTAGTATGTVTFKDGATVLGVATLSDGKAALSTTKLVAGAHSITAVYNGDADYLTSTSAAITQTVNAGT